MKIQIIGDVHIGSDYRHGHKDHVTGRNTRLLDYELTLKKTIEEGIDEGCEIIIFTGDIFEHRHPNALYQKIFSEYLYFALSNGIKEIHIVIGNHDQQRITNATTISYLQELSLPNIIVHDNLSHKTIIKNGQAEINLLFFPYRDRKWLEVETYQEAIQKLDSELKYELSCIDNQAPKLLVGHMALEGTFFADEYAELISENELFLPKTMFDKIEVTIMGHVHTPHIISESPHIAYVGSMEKRGAFEKHDKKFAIVDTITKDISYRTEPCRELYDFKIDLAEKVYGELLMDEIFNFIDMLSKDKKMKGSIVQILLNISADDSKFCLSKQIETYIKDKWNVSHCLPVKPILFFSRQARDSSITEHASDRESFIKYMKNVTEDSIACSNITEIGLEIIKAGGGT